MRLRRSFPVLLSGAAMLFLAVAAGTTGCKGFFIPPCTTNCGGGGGPYSSYAYVANATVGTVAGFPVPTAAFTNLTGTTTTLGATPSAIAATPKGTFLYVATLQGSVVVYSIGTNGVLTLGNNGAAVTSTINPTWMTVDPSGNWLFLVSNSSPQVLVFQIDSSTGTLTQSSQGTVALSTGNPTQVYVTPNGQYVYIGLGAGGLDGFTFNSSTGALAGKLHTATRIAGGSSDNAIAADNKSAYLLVGEAGSGIRVFTIGSGGALNEVSGSPFASQLGPKSIVVDPTNTYVYVANSTASVITGYTLGTGGALTPLSSSPFNTGSAPYALSLDSTGKYLFAISNGGSPDLQVFRFDSAGGGKLDLVVSTATGTDPTGAVSLAVVP